MRRRLTITIAGVVAAALVLAGLGTLVLIRRSARDEARRDLARQVESIADQADSSSLQVFRRALQLEGATVVGIGPAGGVRTPLPAPVRPRDLSVERLRAGEILSGTRGELVWAAAPVPRPRGLAVVVLTQRVSTGTRRAAAYLLVAGIATLVLAAGAAGWLARRITSPLQQAEAATRRIAAGELSVSVPEAGSEPELASLARSINTMAATLDRARQAERQFLMSVSHDLRTPLTSIRGFAEAISDGTADDTRRAARVITAESRRLERLVGDLLDLARIDARQFTLDVRDVDVAEIVADTSEGFRPAIEEEGLELSVDTGPSVIVQADADRLAQVVANLVENAFKFACSRVEVGVAAGGGTVVVTVADDGPGIAAADLSSVFERRYQVDRTPARRVGSGLGLAIVAELVAAMGGTVEAAPGEPGTVISVRLSGSSSSGGPLSSSA